MHLAVKKHYEKINTADVEAKNDIHRASIYKVSRGRVNGATIDEQSKTVLPLRQRSLLEKRRELRSGRSSPACHSLHTGRSPFPKCQGKA